ncbi:MAG: glycoside hydrolase family 3 N-terminal domain-containing protein, partial [Acidimicrobiales bacterium]
MGGVGGAGGAGGSGPGARAATGAISRRDQVSSCLLVGLDAPVTTDQLARLVDDSVGGLIVHNGALRPHPTEALAGLLRPLRERRPDLLVAADEEGGAVSCLEAERGSSYPGNLALGVVDDPELTRRLCASLAAELASAGINYVLAPVVDVDTNLANPVIATRSFGRDPALVARHGAAAVAGFQEAGLAACAKHFPGHGATDVDSHLDLPTVERSRAGLDEIDLAPFRAAIQAGVASVMSSHVVYPAIGAEPATTSRAILTDLLRGELGYDGVVVSDALEMGAISGTVGVAEGAVAAMAAGCDLLC